MSKSKKLKIVFVIFNIIIFISLFIWDLNIGLEVSHFKISFNLIWVELFAAFWQWLVILCGCGIITIIILIIFLIRDIIKN